MEEQKSLSMNKENINYKRENQQFCVIFINNTNKNFIKFCLNNVNNLKIFENKILTTRTNINLNNSYGLLISINLLQKKYLQIFINSHSFLKINIFGILYQNSLYSFNNFVKLLQKINNNDSNFSIINNRFFVNYKMHLIKILILLNVFSFKYNKTNNKNF